MQLKRHCIEFGVVRVDSAIVVRHGAHTLSDISAFVNSAGREAIVTWRGKTRMDNVGILFEFYTVPL